MENLHPFGEDSLLVDAEQYSTWGRVMPDVMGTLLFRKQGWLLALVMEQYLESREGDRVSGQAGQDGLGMPDPS